jgi:glyoxylase-like metal-dependent hydrolase (beta-lactamase superfamily II)
VGKSSLAVIDPGPHIDAHIDAILAAAGDRPIRWILCTHTHRDHSPASGALRERTGATVIGLPAPAGATQDQAFAPEHVLSDGDVIDIDGARLRALHTPGHASNHVCYWLENTGMLFTGDHVMQGSTVVINPPDGDMAAYLESLMRVRDLTPAIIAPGHGYLVGAAQREIDKLIEHRRWREARVIDALAQSGGGTLDALVPLVYADVPHDRHALAARSLLAHLVKLERDGRVVRRDDAYRLA